MANFSCRNKRIGKVADKVAALYPTTCVKYHISDTYGNISSTITDNRRTLI
ncbi:hypothetical protein [Serratia sp. (in: enterobacteria)]|uniref:hypothetical protein n=1 Tax=Serratia sp. (in: enterobacteria) TaxID=616 RepID=UPI00398932C0